jgi:hypothetical protein
MNLFKKIKKDAVSDNKEALSTDLNSLIGTEMNMGGSLIAKMLLARLTFIVEKSQTFKNSEEQVDSFLVKYPNMMIYRQEIIDKAKKFRKDNGLPE